MLCVTEKKCNKNQPHKLLGMSKFQEDIFFAVSSRVKHNRLSERETTRSRWVQIDKVNLVGSQFFENSFSDGKVIKWDYVVSIRRFAQI